MGDRLLDSRREVVCMFECEYFQVTDEQIEKYEYAYPAVNVLQEMRKMEVWLDANPERRKKKYERFIVNWLGKAHSNLLNAELGVLMREGMRKSRIPI